MSLIILP